MNSSTQPKFVCRWEPTELASTILSGPGREVVRYWISALEFLDENMHPVLLSMDNLREPTFTQLVQAVSPALVASVVLNELLRKGVVEQLNSGQVLLRRSTYIHDVPGFDVSPGVRRRNHRSVGSAGRRYSDDI